MKPEKPLLYEAAELLYTENEDNEPPMRKPRTIGEFRDFINANGASCIIKK